MKMNYEKEMASVLKQAMAESRRRGRAEEKLEVAMKMLEAGICFKEIYMFTGMKKEEIMFELDGMISTVKQADRHEHQQAEWHESAESDASMDGTDEPWTEAEIGMRRTDESDDQWTRVEAEGMENGTVGDPWIDGSEDPWAEENPNDWRSVAEEGPWENKRAGENVPNLWAKGKTGGAVNEELKEKLVLWRREQCRTENVRAYMIIPQRTLLEIAAKIPKTRDELMAINGFGNARWEKYGERILQMTSGF